MSFCKGFEKTAGKIPSPANVMGQAAGYATRGAAATTKAGKQVASNVKNVVKEHSKKQKVAFTEGYKKARGPAEDAAKGAGKNKGPSFASRHPYMTAGLLYLGTKAMLGGGDDKQSSQPPQYVGPQ